MKTLEEVIENKASFVADPSEGIVSKQTFKPEDYSLDFLKEKIKSLCYFLVSISINNPSFIYIYIGEKCEYEYKGNTHVYLSSKKVTYMHCDIDSFMKIFEDCFEDQKTYFLYKIPTKPFHIIVKPERWHEYPYPSRWEVRGPLSGSFTEEELPISNLPIFVENFTSPIDSLRAYLRARGLPSEEENDEKETTINTEQIFKSVECVICLTNPPNVLFCNCGHLCICIECDKVKSVTNCPICKTEDTIKRTIEY